MRCVDPVQVMIIRTGIPKANRCSSVMECPEHSCIRPEDSEQLLRIIFQLPSWQFSDNTREEVILWKGPRKELLEQG
jgi:hypothetical protein